MLGPCARRFWLHSCSRPPRPLSPARSHRPRQSAGARRRSPSSASCRAARRRCRQARATGSFSTCGSTRRSTWQRRSNVRWRRDILAQLRATAKHEGWRDMDAVGRAGYKVRPRPRKPGDRSTYYFHAEYTKQRGGRFTLDPSRPKALIFANAPGAPLVLVGAMWSMRRGERGPTPPDRSFAGTPTSSASRARNAARSRSPEEPARQAHDCARARRCSTSGSRAISGARISTSAPVRELCKTGLLGRGSC